MYGNNCNHSCPCCCGTATYNNIVFYVEGPPKKNPLKPLETLPELKARLSREAVRENGKLLRTSLRESRPPPPRPRTRNRCCSGSSKHMVRI